MIFFFVIDSVTRLDYPFLGVLYCCIMRNTSPHIFLATFKECFFQWFFCIWRTTGSLPRTFNFTVHIQEPISVMGSWHILRLYQDAFIKRLTDSSFENFFTLNVSCCECNLNDILTFLPHQTKRHLRFLLKFNLRICLLHTQKRRVMNKIHGRAS